MPLHWLSAIIPIFTAFFLFLFWKRKVAWWEFLLLFAISPICIFACAHFTEKYQTADTEYWTGHVVAAEYYEEWDEEVPCRHPKYKTVTRTRTNSKGRIETYTETVQDGYLHSYDVDYHGPEWKLITNHEKSPLSTSQSHFHRLASIFGNKKYESVPRAVTYHRLRGQKYVTRWPGSEDNMEVVVTQHTYENRIQAGNSTFKFRPVDKKFAPVIDYPKLDHFHQPCILGHCQGCEKAERKLSVWNAKLGKDKQVRMYVVIFKNEAMDAALQQESYWQGGNKNEFIMCVGVDDDNAVTWAYPISWTENEGLKIDVRDYFVSMKKLDIEKGVDYMANAVAKDFQRKHFKDFSYISVDPPLWAILTTMAVTLLVNVGLSIWFVRNSHDA